MSKRLIKFHDPHEVQDFANKVSRYPYDMDLKRGRYIVDAKSILSILSMGFDNKIELKVYEDESEELNGLWNDISPYLAPVR
ncbi:phosphocarrier protein HPr [Lachnospiraceae bacterium PF1-21]|uniref:HPr family phosphocarrier protein n=1 Tax=Ohessyouella blattaphilus TaxID=2949333 RepID=UPI00256B5417|nr:HPr family phosphocarrier protein [Lachnospiraceae bacterium OttesenSCG-928-J05]